MQRKLHFCPKNLRQGILVLFHSVSELGCICTKKVFVFQLRLAAFLHFVSWAKGAFQLLLYSGFQVILSHLYPCEINTDNMQAKITRCKNYNVLCPMHVKSSFSSASLWQSLVVVTLSPKLTLWKTRHIEHCSYVDQWSMTIAKIKF